MIIRLLGEGQYDVAEDAITALNALDTRLQAAVDAADTGAFTAALGELLAAVRAHGSPVPDAVLTTSELVLPAADSDPREVAALLGDEGLIPG